MAQLNALSRVFIVRSLYKIIVTRKHIESRAFFFFFVRITVDYTYIHDHYVCTNLNHLINSTKANRTEKNSTSVILSYFFIYLKQPH